MQYKVLYQNITNKGEMYMKYVELTTENTKNMENSQIVDKIMHGSAFQYKLFDNNRSLCHCLQNELNYQRNLTKKNEYYIENLTDAVNTLCKMFDNGVISY